MNRKITVTALAILLISLLLLPSASAQFGGGDADNNDGGSGSDDSSDSSGSDSTSDSDSTDSSSDDGDDTSNEDESSSGSSSDTDNETEFDGGDSENNDNDTSDESGSLDDQNSDSQETSFDGDDSENNEDESGFDGGDSENNDNETNFGGGDSENNDNETKKDDTTNSTDSSNDENNDDSNDGSDSDDDEAETPDSGDENNDSGENNNTQDNGDDSSGDSSRSTGGGGSSRVYTPTPDSNEESQELEAEINPKRIQIGEPTVISGNLDGGSNTNHQIEILVNGEEEARTNTDSNGEFKVEITPSEIGNNEVRVRADSTEKTLSIYVTPTVNIVSMHTSLDTAAGSSIKVCADVRSQTDAELTLQHNSQKHNSKEGQGELCFRPTMEQGENRFRAIATVEGDRDEAQISRDSMSIQQEPTSLSTTGGFFNSTTSSIVAALGILTAIAAGLIAKRRHISIPEGLKPT